MIYLTLFYEFFKAGLFAVGGGLATLPFLYAMSDKMGWFTYAQLTDMIAISESTPGPIGVNMATYVGFEIAGIPGAVAATMGLVAPSVIVILIVASFLQKFRHNNTVEAVFYGLRPASAALIASAGLLIILIALFNVDAYQATGDLSTLVRWKAMALATVLAALTQKFDKVHPGVFLALSAVAGALFRLGGV